MPPVPDLFSLFELSPDQQKAASLREVDLVVSAGAGSGKTRILVARYLSLLAEGHAPERLVAITFTEKAAREMRNRVRRELTNLRRIAKERQDGPISELASILEPGRLEAARIGTIHSLCSEILHAHPAQAGIDPEFQVLDEGLTAALRAQKVEECLSWAALDPEMVPLFDITGTRGLRGILTYMIARRLDYMDWLEAEPITNGKSIAGQEFLYSILSDFALRPVVVDSLTYLQEVDTQGDLVTAGEAFARRVQGCLSLWKEAQEHLARGDINGTVKTLITMRKQHMDMRGKSDPGYMEAFRSFRNLFDANVYPWIKDGIDLELESSLFFHLPLLVRLFRQLMNNYQTHLRSHFSLDFDDLEEGALKLLRNSEIARHWQESIDAVLVDEYQDTNNRQRLIVQRLCGEERGRLFVVGDDRQSIYRFRGADVTVFRATKDETRGRGGAWINLEQTFRAHHDLIITTGSILETCMRIPDEAAPPYWVPFSPLTAFRNHPQEGVRSPYFEVVLGRGENATTGRSSAALALAQRLIELQRSGEIADWHAAALLFRASTHFAVYEDALEKVGIPFVTVSGRGFYERPEIRDLLNLLRAVADPWDDLALAGLLRSPAFGLDDASLYRLRFPPGSEGPQPMLTSLKGDLSHLDKSQSGLAQRAAAILAEISPLADRLPVGELLDRLIDASDYRLILAAAPGSSSASGRQWRNLDKLVEDAYASQLVQVRAFLQYLETLNSAGAREGEASVEAEGAVQLMTIHKAKGLEFPVVVIADAAYTPPSRSSPAYLAPDASLAIKSGRDYEPLLFRFMKMVDADQDRAEDRRLLYVAATRAREKLILSGQVKLNKGNIAASGWLKDICDAVDLNLNQICERPDVWQELPLPNGQCLGVWAAPETIDVSGFEAPSTPFPESLPASHLGTGVPLYRHGVEFSTKDLYLHGHDEDENRTGEEHSIGAKPFQRSVERMVKRCLSLWRLPPDPGLPDLLGAAALDAGLVDHLSRQAAVQRAVLLLERLRVHPLALEVEQALDRRTAVPFNYQRNGIVKTSSIDLIFRYHKGWHGVNFVVEALEDNFSLGHMASLQLQSLKRAAHLLKTLPGGLASLSVCILDYKGEIVMVEEERKDIA